MFGKRAARRLGDLLAYLYQLLCKDHQHALSLNSIKMQATSMGGHVMLIGLNLMRRKLFAIINQATLKENNA